VVLGRDDWSTDPAVETCDSAWSIANHDTRTRIGQLPGFFTSRTGFASRSELRHYGASSSTEMRCLASEPTALSSITRPKHVKVH
jgi:hypothetical protein